MHADGHTSGTLRCAAPRLCSTMRLVAEIESRYFIAAMSPAPPPSALPPCLCRSQIRMECPETDSDAITASNIRRFPGAQSTGRAEHASARSQKKLVSIHLCDVLMRPHHALHPFGSRAPYAGRPLLDGLSTRGYRTRAMCLICGRTSRCSTASDVLNPYDRVSRAHIAHCLRTGLRTLCRHRALKSCPVASKKQRPVSMHLAACASRVSARSEDKKSFCF